MGFNKSHITNILYGALFCVALSFLIFEWIQFKANSELSDLDNVANQAVEESFKVFQNKIFDFTYRSTEYSNQIATALSESNDLTLSKPPPSNFWGSAVFIDDNPVLWHGYISIDDLELKPIINNDISLQRKRDGNVQFLESTIQIKTTSNKEDTRVHVVTRLLLEQEHTFQIITNGNRDDQNFSAQKNTFPVKISYSSIRQDSIIHSKRFESKSGDFIALLYATESDKKVFVSKKNIQLTSIRSYFLLTITLLFTILIVWVCRFFPAHKQLVIHWSLLIILYLLQKPIFLSLFPTDLISLTINALFLILAYLSFYKCIRYYYSTDNKDSSNKIYIISFGQGMVASIFALYIQNGMYSTIVDTELNVFKQILTSSVASTVWIWASGTALLLLVSLFNTLLLHGLNNKRCSSFHVFLYTFFGVLFPISIAFFLAHSLAINILALSISTILLLCILGVTFLQHRVKILNTHFSLIRILLVINIMVACSFTSTIYFSFDEVLNTKLNESSVVFEEDNEAKIRQVITDLLTTASSEVRSISLYSVSNFEQIINNLLIEEWLAYSFSIQLIDKNGSPQAVYNTNLSVPQWTTDFRIDELIIPYEEERIRKDNLRPVLRSKPIKTVNADYSYFMLGWIPIFKSRNSTTISGWLLATLYKEVPELNRPFRSVVNGTIQSPEETAFAFTEYKEGIPARSIVSGTLASIPDYGILPSSILKKLEQDSVYIQSKSMQNMMLKERFHIAKNGSVIRVAYQKIAFPQILYVFLRIFFTVSVPILLFLLLFRRPNKSLIHSESRRIRDRLIDRAIIASIVCLFLLIGATSLIFESQNRSNVQDALREKLSILTETLSNATRDMEVVTSDYLEDITAVLSVDASIYKYGSLEHSTTPPIYNQHLIPTVIPWPIYQQIVANGAQIVIDIQTIGDQELMIGYQPWLNADNTIAGMVAIPTFLKTPDFYNQLLSNTSYLVAFYVLIFSILILIIGFISAKITAPLKTLEAGLEKISAGNLDTRLKIHSNDEIGILAKAYNAMAAKLKTLQEELAKTEREEAWKQMAQQVAHEIKNPLTPMKLNLQHLERQLHQTEKHLSLDKPRISAITKSMIEQIEALNKIASDFSKFARPTTDQFTEIKVNALISSVVLMYEESKSEISTDFDNREFIISGVPDELRRVLVNIIKNAEEAISDDGWIKIKTRWDKEGKSVDIFVTDNGIGISSKEAQHIFLPNFSTKTSGTGLGLAITKKIIEEHSGTITFESSPKKGTTFKISFPL